MHEFHVVPTSMTVFFVQALKEEMYLAYPFT